MRFPHLVKISPLVVILISTSLFSRGAEWSSATPQTEQREILFAVIGKDLRSVDTLRKEDFKVLEDGKPQEIIEFQKLDNRPLSLAILIDTSASQEKTLPLQRLTADAFVRTIMRPDKDQAAVITFTGKLTVQQALIGDVPLLRQAIERAKFVPPPGYMSGGIVRGPGPMSGDPALLLGSTALWDAISNTCQDVLVQAATGSRKAIILLSDGEDTSSKIKLSEAIDRAVKADVAVYSIGIGDTYNFEVNTGALKKLSDQTGGQAFFPSKASSLETAFATIKALLYLQYRMTYRSSLAWTKKSPEHIKLELINPMVAGKGFHLSYQVLIPPQNR